jgi:hypothetical protein
MIISADNKKSIETLNSRLQGGQQVENLV